MGEEAYIDNAGDLRNCNRFGKNRLEWTLNKLLKGAGAGADPTEIDVPSGAQITSGQYTGDNTANRAIAHGLGVAPKFVFITRIAAYNAFVIINGQAWIVCIHTQEMAVTAPDATNFYVGNAGSYPNSANGNALIYDWAAIG